MRGDEIIAFLRGTRPRAPPGPKRKATATLLVVASALHLPLVYLLVADGVHLPSATLLVGLLSIGLAWCGGVSLEGRRPGTVRLAAAIAIAEVALAFVPAIAEPLGSARWLFVAIAALAAAALLFAGPLAGSAPKRRNAEKIP